MGWNRIRSTGRYLERAVRVCCLACHPEQDFTFRTLSSKYGFVLAVDSAIRVREKKKAVKKAVDESVPFLHPSRIHPHPNHSLGCGQGRRISGHESVFVEQVVLAALRKHGH